MDTLTTINIAILLIIGACVVFSALFLAYSLLRREPARVRLDRQRGNITSVSVGRRKQAQGRKLT